MNLPNYITLSRIAAVPLLIWLLTTGRLSSQSGMKEITAVAVFLLASLTDGLDGYLARKRGQETTMGMLLDPLADKLMIAGAFIALVQFNPRIVPAWVAVIVIGREFLVSGLRSIAAAQGFTIEASDLGKFKMVVQIITIVAAITSKLTPTPYPTDVLIAAPEGGLKTDSMALLNQLRSVDRLRLVKRIGSLRPETMQKVDQALQISIGLIKI